jgi:hypothetical protein
VTRGQLAILPNPDGRRAERRIVNLAARLREPGARVAEIEVVDLSTDGFMARGAAALEPGASVWLKMAGLEPQSSEVVWVEGDRAGCKFATPLHPATLEQLVAVGRRPLPRGHFGARGAIHHIIGQASPRR